VHADLVIGADGLGSTVAREAGAQIIRRGTASAAVLYRYGSVDIGGGYHWHFREGESAGVIPTDSGLSCIFVSAPTERFDAELRHAPDASFRSVLERVAPRVAAAARFAPEEPLRIFRGAPGVMRQPCGPGWMLVGDAGFFRDPITSHGISDAFRDAEGAALAALAGSEAAMRAFQDERDGCAHAIFDATEAICRFDWTFEELQQRHRHFSEAMKAECAVIDARGLDRHASQLAI
jgi:2-polyprenyl-6-methoxyphenol hydroxylase-like FAD-dependent oxidoreductase